MKEKALFIALFTLMVATTLLTSACQSSAPTQAAATPTPDTEAEARKQEAMRAAESQPLESLVASFQRLAALTSFRTKVDSTANGRASVVKTEFVAPGSFHVMNGPTEFIVVGENAYMKTLGAWQKVAGGLEDQMKGIRSSELLDQVRQATNVKFIKADAVDGKPALIYEYTTTNLLSAAGTIASRTWVSLQDGLPHKSEFAGNLGEYQTSGVITWYDYNRPDIKIEPPLK